jgi:hypothetical protein
MRLEMELEMERTKGKSVLRSRVARQWILVIGVRRRERGRYDRLVLDVRSSVVIFGKANGDQSGIPNVDSASVSCT